jgi:hypothetical protein
MKTTRAVFGLGLLLALGAGACAAGPPPAAKSASGGQDAAPASPAAQQPMPSPQEAQAGYAQPPPAAQPARPTDEPRPATPATSPAPGGGAAPGASRAAAIQSAARDVESSLRELDVAAGDCHNACRALSSMDRAAGRLCGLVPENDDQRRCEGAKAKLYSARDRVRTTCGSCPGGASVDRSAPVPSIR